MSLELSIKSILIEEFVSNVPPDVVVGGGVHIFNTLRLAVFTVGWQLEGTTKGIPAVFDDRHSGSRTSARAQTLVQWEDLGSQESNVKTCKARGCFIPRSQVWSKSLVTWDRPKFPSLALPIITRIQLRCKVQTVQTYLPKIALGLNTSLCGAS